MNVVAIDPGRVHVNRPLPRKQFGTFDNLSDRRDLYRLLERLDQLSEGVAPDVGCARRRKFWSWCCEEAARNSGMKVVPAPETVGLTGEIYRDVIGLCCLPGYLDIETVARRLEQIVRGLR